MWKNTPESAQKYDRNLTNSKYKKNFFGFQSFIKNSQSMYKNFLSKKYLLISQQVLRR